MYIDCSRLASCTSNFTIPHVSVPSEGDKVNKSSCHEVSENQPSGLACKDYLTLIKEPLKPHKNQQKVIPVTKSENE